MSNDLPNLGLATTRELLDELRARIEIHALGGLDYRTVDGEKFAEPNAFQLGAAARAAGIVK